MHKLLVAAITVVTLASNPVAMAQERARPTIVLVHGAFAESASWSGVVERLEKDGYRVIAAANGLRSVKEDAEPISALIGSIKGPIVLVGHSYGGPVITTAASGHDNVKALVYVAAFAPEVGESAQDLTGRFPGSTLPGALQSVSLPNGREDLYVLPAKFHQQFAADVTSSQAAIMAATQRPVAKAALSEAATVATWKTIPNYSIYGSADRNIPPVAMKFMADRSKARRSVVVPGASHSLMVSHPGEVASIIETAASGK